jgi:hypothetical protein
MGIPGLQVQHLELPRCERNSVLQIRLRVIIRRKSVVEVCHGDPVGFRPTEGITNLSAGYVIQRTSSICSPCVGGNDPIL